jgi:hypothetical protein
LAAFFILTYSITWGLAAFALLLPGLFRSIFGELTQFSPLYYVAVAAPTISATVVTALSDGRERLMALFARLFRWRFEVRWYAVVLIALPTAGWLAGRFAGAELRVASLDPTVLLPVLLAVMSTGPLCEELGWRGFALPRLLDRLSPFAASLLLGAVWGVWHLPSFFMSGFEQAAHSLPLFLLLALFISILATWLFVRTGGSVLVTVLLHFAVNLCNYVLGVPLPALSAIVVGAALLAVALDRSFGWFAAPEGGRSRQAAAEEPVLAV